MLSELSKIIIKSEEVLLQKIVDSKNRKESLYLLYSEFCLRAKDNLDYYNVINNSDYLGVDGKGIVWALNAIDHYQTKLKIGNLEQPNPNPLSFCVVYVGNIVSAINFILLKKLTHTTNGINLILGRSLTYSLLDLAQKKDWKVLLIAGGELEVVKQNILLKYPSLELDYTQFDINSIVMKDGLDYNVINQNNLFDIFPELILATTKVSETKPDLILVGLGGTSGKQEFLIDYLKNESELDFGLAVGIGAALDHLGGGKKQKEAPSWIQKYGLEFLWRIVNQPYRIKRILDSVCGLIQLVTEEMLKGKNLDEKS